MIPCLNRDGDLLSDLVLPLFGSIAGAESVLLALDDELRPTVAMAEAPHGTAPGARGQGRRQPDGDDPRRRGALLHYAAETDASAPRGLAGDLRRACSRPSPRARERPISAGHAATTEFTDAVIELVDASSKSGQPGA